MPELTRSQFCEITKLPPETVKTMDRRQQLPFSIDQKTSGRGYSFFEAFLMIAAQEFSEGHGVNMNRAAEIAGSLPDALAQKWASIVETADRLAEGTGEKVEEIMCGQYGVAGLHHPRPVAGSDAEIDQELASLEEPVIRSIRSSASRSLALLFIRCGRAGIGIPEDFRSGALTYRPRVNAAELSTKIMRKLLDEGAHHQETDE